MSRPRRASVALGLCVGTIISWLSQIFCAVTSRISRYTTYINRSNSCRIYENVEELPKLIGMVPLDRVRTSFNVLDFFSLLTLFQKKLSLFAANLVTSRFCIGLNSRLVETSQFSQIKCFRSKPKMPSVSR
jgi:hypothetical protein